MDKLTLEQVKAAVAETYRVGNFWLSNTELDRISVVFPVVILLFAGLAAFLFAAAEHPGAMKLKRITAGIFGVSLLCLSAAIGWAGFFAPVDGPAKAAAVVIIRADSYLSGRQTAGQKDITTAEVLDDRYHLGAAIREAETIQRKLALISGQQVLSANTNVASLSLLLALR